MSDLINKTKIYKPSYRDSEKSHIQNMNEYKNLYDRSIKDPEDFWAEQAERLDWFKKWDKVSNNDFTKAQIKWFEGGKLNVSYNCLDRHIKAGYGDQTALIWEGNDPNTDTALSYSELLLKVSKFANILKSKGVEKGDRVCIYMQMIPELTIAMLACARIGAVHSIVFGAFSSDSLRDRINDSECKVLTSADGCITFSLIGQGDQSWRTTCMLFSEDAVLWGMDSPGEPSFIIRWDRLSKEREFVTELPGPIWHGTSNADGWYTFSTAVEPGDYLKEPQAYLWTSPNGFNFYKVAAYDKDFWPWTFFQFGLIYFPIGIAPENYLVFSGNALKQYENTMVIARLVP